MSVHNHWDVENYPLTSTVLLSLLGESSIILPLLIHPGAIDPPWRYCLFSHIAPTSSPTSEIQIQPEIEKRLFDTYKKHKL